MNNPKYGEDQRKEEKLHKYFEKFYQDNGFLFARIQDTIPQKLGVDVIAKNNDKAYIIDEKSAISCWNRNLETFSFELRTETNYNKNGWFINPSYLTTHYALLYVRANDKMLEDITSIEIIIVSKKKLYDYLISLNADINKRMKTIIIDGKSSDLPKIKNYINKDVYLVYSLWIKPEMPINIIISKEKLIELSEFHQFVSI